MSKDKFNLPALPEFQPLNKGRISPLDAGLIVGDPKKIPPNAATDMDQMRFEAGGLRQDYPLSQFGGNSVGNITGMIEVVDPGLTGSGSMLFKRVGTAWYATSLSGNDYLNWYDTSCTFTYSLAQPYIALRYVLGYVIACYNARTSQVAYPEASNDFQLGGAGFSVISSIGFHRDVEEFADRAVFIGSARNNDGVEWSVNGNPIDVTGTGSGNTTLGSSSGLAEDVTVTGKKIGNFLSIFRYRSIVRGFRTGVSEPAIGFSPWIDGLGSESQFSVVTAEDGVAFMGHDRQMYFLTETQPRPIPFGNNILPYLRSAIRKEKLDLVICAYDQSSGFFHVAVPIGNVSLCNFIFSIDFAHFLSTGEEKWYMRDQDVQYMIYCTRESYNL